MSLIHLETKSPTVKLEIHKSRLLRSSLLQPPTSVAGCQLDGWITNCSETCRWVSKLTSLGLEHWELATAALLCTISSIFHSERFQNPHLLYLPPTAQWLDLTTHCHLDHFQPPLNKPSSLYRVASLFIHRVSKCDFLDLSPTVHIHWASLNIRAEKHL